MASFDKKTVAFILKNQFHKNVLKFVLYCIPSFDDKITVTQNKVDENPSNSRWYFLTSVPFKTLITQHQDQFPSRHMAKDNMGSSQEENS